MEIDNVVKVLEAYLNVRKAPSSLSVHMFSPNLVARSLQVVFGSYPITIYKSSNWPHDTIIFISTKIYIIMDWNLLYRTEIK